MTTKADKHTAAKITPEDVAKMRMLINQPEPNTEHPWHPVADPNDFRRYLHNCGDDNPLYIDSEYGAESRWRSVIAPPMFIITMGFDESGVLPPEIKEKSRGALRGIGMYQSGFEFEWYRPIFPGDRLHKKSFISDVIEKESAFANKSVMVKHQTSYMNARGEDIGAYRFLMIHAERGTAAKKGKYKATEPAMYSEEDVAKIDEVYENQYRRGAEPRYWEDVEEGEALTPMVKGPLTMVDIIGFHIAIGWGGFGINPGRMNYLNRKRMPRFYVPGRYGFPEVVQRMHWEEDWAKKVGTPMSYDYGMMRAQYTIQYLTDWMGDDAWLWKMECEMRKFNYHGDIQWFGGKVARKFQDGPHYCVEVETWAESQREEVTTPGKGVIILPSREGGPARVPDSPQNTDARKALADRA